MFSFGGNMAIRESEVLELIEWLENDLVEFDAQEALREEDASDEVSFNGPPLEVRVYWAHVRRVLDALKPALMSSAVERRRAYEDYLARHRVGTGCNSLSYTAIASSTLTELNIKIAEYLAWKYNGARGAASDRKEDTPPKHAIEFLLPGIHGIHLKSMNPRDNLVPIWHEMNQLGRNLKRPHWVTPSYDISRVLKTHVLSSTGNSLVPISLLTELDASPEFPPRIEVCFGDASLAPESLYYPNETVERLLGHSDKTRRVRDALIAYADIATRSDTLFGTLNTLKRMLHANDSNSAFGSEEVAGEGASAFIFQFTRFYIDLTYQGDAVRDEDFYRTYAEALAEDDFKDLPSVASLLEKRGIPYNDEEENALDALDERVIWCFEVCYTTNHVDQITACIGTAAEDLDDCLPKLANLLDAVGYDEGERVDRIETARARVRSAQAELQASLDKGDYEGHDRLGIGPEILAHTNTVFNFEDGMDASLLSSMSPEAICHVLSDELAVADLVDAYSSLGDFVLLLWDKTPEQVEAITASCRDEMAMFGSFGFTSELKYLFETLGRARTEAFLKGLGPKLRMFFDTKFLKSVLKKLELDEAAILCRALRPYLERKFTNNIVQQLYVRFLPKDLLQIIFEALGADKVAELACNDETLAIWFKNLSLPNFCLLLAACDSALDNRERSLKDLLILIQPIEENEKRIRLLQDLPLTLWRLRVTRELIEKWLPDAQVGEIDVICKRVVCRMLETQISEDADGHADSVFKLTPHEVVKRFHAKLEAGQDIRSLSVADRMQLARGWMAVFIMRSIRLGYLSESAPRFRTATTLRAFLKLNHLKREAHKRPRDEEPVKRPLDTLWGSTGIRGFFGMFDSYRVSYKRRRIKENEEAPSSHRFRFDSF